MTSERRRALLGKYRQLARWRAARDAGSGPRPGATAIGTDVALGGTPFPGRVVKESDRAAMGGAGPHAMSGEAQSTGGIQARGDADDAAHERAPPVSRDGRLLRHAAGAEPANRAAMRALSENFPGCLRELDVLGAAEIARRITVLQETSGAVPAWVTWIDAYHRWMRAALTLRRRMSRADRLVGLSLAQVAELRQMAAGLIEPDDAIDDAFIHAVAAPPAGRLSPVVLGILAKQFGVPAAQISTTLFPPRRPPEIP